MQIQVNTDDNIEGRENLVRHIETEVGRILSRFGDQVTRVEIHLSDENAGKPGNADKRCLMEARPAGRPPVTAGSAPDQGRQEDAAIARVHLRASERSQRWRIDTDG